VQEHKCTDTRSRITGVEVGDVVPGATDHLLLQAMEPLLLRCPAMAVLLAVALACHRPA